MPRSLGRHGRRWRTVRARLMAEAPDICHICGHAGGAYEADHDPPLSIIEALGEDPCDARYLRRAHGTESPCPVCRARCNQAKGARLEYAPLSTSEAW